MHSSAPHIHIEIHGNVYQHFSGTSRDSGSEAAPFLLPDELGEIVRIKPEITFNNNRTTKNGRKAPDGIEIRFGNTRPTEAVRQELKDHGFQFSEKQTMWYAYDNEKSRPLAERWMNEEVEVDNTQYVKQHFWARVRSQEEYSQLREYTEFFLKADPPKNYNGKKQLESTHYPLARMMREGLLFFKKHFNRAIEEEDDPATPYDSTAIAQRLKDLAQSMDKAIDEKINSATSKQQPTPKRMRVAAGMREEGRALQEIQNTLFALSDAHLSEAMDKYPLLQTIRTKRQVELLLKYDKFTKNGWSLSNTFENAKEELARLGINNIEQWGEAAKQHTLLMANHADPATAAEREKQDKIKRLEERVFNENIPGFFPTPPDLIERMLDLADIKDWHAVLDPSAGKGDILDAVASRLGGNKYRLSAYEINSSLREILELKGYRLWGRDFLERTPTDSEFDRIIMNPPFENSQDIDHVTHALKFLHPGGRLVAIVSEGPFYREFKKDKAFRDLLKRGNAYISDPIKEGFKHAFKRTNFTVRIIAINETGTPIIPNNTQYPSGDMNTENNEQDDIALLELEAEAELELLKLRVEMERKRKPPPLEGIDSGKLQQYRQKAWELEQDTSVFDFK